MIAVVGFGGNINIYTDGTLPIFAAGRPIRVELSRDNQPVGDMMFDLLSVDENPYATELAYLLSGAYVKVTGDAKFDVHDPALLLEALEEVR